MATLNSDSRVKHSQLRKLGPQEIHFLNGDFTNIVLVWFDSTHPSLPQTIPSVPW